MNTTWMLRKQRLRTTKKKNNNFPYGAQPTNLEELYIHPAFNNCKASFVFYVTLLCVRVCVDACVMRVYVCVLIMYVCVCYICVPV